MKRKAVITGTAGYLGAQLAEYFERGGWDVARIPGRQDFAALAQAALRPGSEPDLVVHAGFQVDFRFAAEPGAASDNVENTRLLLAAAAAAQARHFVFLSAAGALGVGEHAFAVRDETLLGRSDPEFQFWLASRYIRDKLACEDLIDASGLFATTLYLTTTYGPGMQARVRASLAGMRSAWRLILPVPPGGTSFLDLGDLLAAFAEILEKKLPGRFVVSSGNLSYRDLVRALLSLEPPRRGRIILTLPRFLIRAIRKIAFYRQGWHPDTVLPSSSGYKYYSPAKLMQQSSWRPRARIEESLARALPRETHD